MFFPRKQSTLSESRPGHHHGHTVYELQEELMDLKEAMAVLTEKERTAVILRKCQRKSYREIGMALNMLPGDAALLCAQGLTRLREVLSR